MGSWSEGTSVSLLEAMAQGVAPVVTAVGGNPAVLGDELAEQAVAPGEPETLARAIELALDPERGKHLGSVARQRVKAAFNLEAMVKGYEDLYSSVVRRASPR
jgi:glycosyltransferase involved in cell wall biosynthesis